MHHVYTDTYKWCIHTFVHEHMKSNCFDKDLILILTFGTVAEDQTADLAVGNYILYAGLRETAAERKDFLYSYGNDSSPCALLWTESGVLCMCMPSIWMWVHMHNIHTSIVCAYVHVFKWTHIDLLVYAQAHLSCLCTLYGFYFDECVNLCMIVHWRKLSTAGF